MVNRNQEPAPGRAGDATWKKIGKLAGILGMLLTSFAGGQIYRAPEPVAITAPAEPAGLSRDKLVQMAEDLAAIKKDLQLLREEVKELRGRNQDGH